MFGTVLKGSCLLLPVLKFLLKAYNFLKHSISVTFHSVIQSVDTDPMNDMMGKISRNRKGQTCCGSQRGTSRDKLLHKLKEKPIIFNFSMVSPFLNLKAVLCQLSCVIHFYYNGLPFSFNFLAILIFLLSVCNPFTFFFCLFLPPFLSIGINLLLYSPIGP